MRRWEAETGRRAPAPTTLTAKYVAMLAKRRAGRDPRPAGMRGSLRPSHQLNAAFVEWMMGLPQGWVVDTEGLTRAQCLKLLGNGVVPQQAYAALHMLAPRLVGDGAGRAA